MVQELYQSIDCTVINIGTQHVLEGRVSIANTGSYVSETLNTLIIQFSSCFLFFAASRDTWLIFQIIKVGFKVSYLLFDIDMHGLVLALNNL